MVRFRNPRTGDIVTAPAVLEEKYEKRGHERVADGPAEELRGAALDQALEDAGLPKTGSADDKRARYAEHLQQVPE